jgi:hypothetical protein
VVPEEVKLVGTIVRQHLAQPFSCDIIGEGRNKVNRCCVNVIDYNVEVVALGYTSTISIVSSKNI